MFNLDEEQLKDQLEHELDETQFLDLCEMSLRELIDMVFEAGIRPEIYDKLERAVR